MKLSYVKMALCLMTVLFLCTSCGTKISTEQEQESVIPFETGVYTFYNEHAEKYLSYRDKQLILSDKKAEWSVETGIQEDFYVYAGDTGLLMDIDNAVMQQGTTIKIWSFTGHDAQRWKVQKNDNGTYTFLSSLDSMFCLAFQDGDSVLQVRDETNVMQEWTVDKVKDLPKKYTSFTSPGGIIELRLPEDITDFVNAKRLQKWAEDLETAYHSFYQLTNYKPYNTIIVEGYKRCEHLGYVVGGSNIIHVDREFLYADLMKMAERENDWNFCALHEMGHLFHYERPWNFESEMMTDLEVAYVLEQNQAEAAPSEFSAQESFRGKEIMSAYKRLGADFSEEYNIFGCVYRFLQIKEEIGWEPFVQTFHELQKQEETYSDASELEMFEVFTSLLSSYGDVEVKDYFSNAEWETICKKLKH